MWHLAGLRAPNLQNATVSILSNSLQEFSGFSHAACTSTLMSQHNLLNALNVGRTVRGIVPLGVGLRT
jgi:hypothetical protein